MPKRSLGTHVSIWEQLVAAATNNIDELIPVVRRDVEILKQALGEIRELKKRQIELRAAAQQATRDLEAVMEKATRASVRVNQGVLATYGSKDEKLTEYGLRPWRPRRRKAIPEDPQSKGNASPSKEKSRKPRRRRGS
jgi:hypothetical protein